MCLCCVHDNNPSLKYPALLFLVNSGDKNLCLSIKLIHLHCNWQLSRIGKVDGTFESVST